MFRKKIGTAQFWNRNDLFLILVIRKRNAEDVEKFSSQELFQDLFI